MGKLTDRAVKSMRLETGEKYVSDGAGLYLRLRPNDKAWVVRFTLEGKAKKIHVGGYPAVSLLDARRLALDIQTKRQSGADPHAEILAERRVAKVKARREADEAKEAQAKVARARSEARKVRASKTRRKASEATPTPVALRGSVRELFERWASIELVRHKDHGALPMGQMERHVLPFIGDLQAGEVTRADVTHLTDRLLAQGKERTAQQILSLVRQMFGFALDRDIVEADPTARIKKSKIGGRPVERDRVLTEGEVKALVRQLPQSELHQHAQHALMLCLACGCRIGELMLAEWSRVDFEARIWHIPAEHAKNGMAHDVQLSDFALERFEILRALDETLARDMGVEVPTWVFPNRSMDGPQSPKTFSKQVSDRQRGGRATLKGRIRPELADSLALPGGHWTPHDLRRTASTTMVKLGVLPEVAERCLNHVEQNRMMRIYQRHSYSNEMREAWQRLGDRLELLSNPRDNVVPITKSA